MNNYQWLLEMDGAERKAWFDAEHEESAQLKDMFGILGNLPTDPGEAAIAAVEGFVRERSNDTFRGENDAKAGSECPNDENGTLDGDTEPENADSRERLEADIRATVPEWHVDTIIGWLDRQRALDGNIEPKSSNTDAESERYATAFKWLDKLDYGKGGVIDNSLCDTPEQGEVVMPLESWREHLGTELENEDSRDKLEADVRKIAEAYNMDTQRHGTERFEHELYCSIIHLLNRRRAIDDSICDECSSDYYEMQEEHDQMIDGIAKIMRLKQPYTFDYDKPLENIETIGRYIDELTAERDELKGQVFTLKCECDDLESTCNVLENEFYNAKAERERYREKFGKCLDYADAIHALMDDEGLA